MSLKLVAIKMVLLLVALCLSAVSSVTMLIDRKLVSFLLSVFCVAIGGFALFVGCGV